ncbi:MAG: transketolase [Desulfovibrionaceae bacterium]|nr:transketolase [Desulfovibrionaceae bacterium]
MDKRSKALRRRMIEIMHLGGRGHLAPAMSLVEIVRVLYDDIMRFDPENPQWEARDRFILSKGHGCLAQYAMLEDKGFITCDDACCFCKFDGILGGHPERDKIPGVEASTGSLGHGLSIGVGFALAARHAGRDNRVFVVMGDGECNEGSVWEAAMSASKNRLDNLVAMVDYNKQQSYGTTTEVLDLEPFADKWRAFGFACVEVDGHDVDALREVLSSVPAEKGRPTAIICHTVKGKGIPFIERDLTWHHRTKLSDELYNSLIEAVS